MSVGRLRIWCQAACWQVGQVHSVQVQFAPGGKHVMVFDLEDTVKAGGTTEMTLTFADGDKLSAPLKVETVTGSGGEEQAP